MSLNSMNDLQTPRRSTTRASCSVKDSSRDSSLGGDDVAVHHLSPSPQLQARPLRKTVLSSSASAAAALTRGHGAARASYATRHETSRKTRRIAHPTTTTTTSSLTLDVHKDGMTSTMSGAGGEKSGGSSNNSSFALDVAEDGQASEEGSSSDEDGGPAPSLLLPSSQQPRCGNVYVPSLPTLVFNEEASNPIAHPINRNVGSKGSILTDEADVSAPFCSVELGDDGLGLGTGVGGGGGGHRSNSDTGKHHNNDENGDGNGVGGDGNDGGDAQTGPLRPLTLLERRKREKRLLSISHLSTLSMETIHEDRHTCEETETQVHSPPKPLFRGWSDAVVTETTTSNGVGAAAHTQRGEDMAGPASRRRPLATRSRGRARLPSYTLPTAAATTSQATGAAVTELRRDPTCGAVRLVSYNILADRLVRSDDYPGCPPEMLAEEYRVNLVKQELAQAAPHLIILEEMSIAVFEAPHSLGDYLRSSLGMEGDHVASTDSRGTVQCHATLGPSSAARPNATTQPPSSATPVLSPPDTRYVDNGSNGTCLQLDAIAEAAAMTTEGASQGPDCPASPRARRRRGRASECTAVEATVMATGTTMTSAVHSGAPSISVSVSETTVTSQTLPPVVSTAPGGLVAGSHTSSVATLSATTVTSGANGGGSGSIAATTTAASTMPPIPLDTPAVLTSPLTSSHELGMARNTSLPQLRSGGPVTGEPETSALPTNATTAIVATPSVSSPSSSLLAAPVVSSPRRTELDGVAIFYDRRRFRLLEKVPLYFNQIAAKEERLTAYERKKLQTNTHNVALISVLHDLQRPDRVYIVAAVHLIWQRVESQLWQAHHLLCTMDQLKRRYGRLSALQLDGDAARQGVSVVTDEVNALYSDKSGALKVTCIVAGDFNADRTSPAFQYLCTGVVPTQCPLLHYWQDELGNSSSSAVAPTPAPPADTAALLARSPRAAWGEAPPALRGLLHGTFSPSTSSPSTQCAASNHERATGAQSVGSHRTVATASHEDDTVLRSHTNSATWASDASQGHHHHHHHLHHYPSSATAMTAGTTSTKQTTVATTLSSHRPAAPYDLEGINSTPPSLRPAPPLLQPQSSSSFRSFTLSPHLSRPVSSGGAGVDGRPGRRSREGWPDDDCTLLTTTGRQARDKGEEERADDRDEEAKEKRAERSEASAADLPQLHRLSTAPPGRPTSAYTDLSPPPPPPPSTPPPPSSPQPTSCACDTRAGTTPVRSMMLLGASFLRRLPSPGGLPLSTSQPTPPLSSHHTRAHLDLHATNNNGAKTNMRSCQDGTGECVRDEGNAQKGCRASDDEALRLETEQRSSAVCCTPRQLTKSTAVLPPQSVPGRAKSGSRGAVSLSGTRREIVKELLSAVRSPSRGLREGGVGGPVAMTAVSPQPLRGIGRSPPQPGMAYARPQLTFARYGHPRVELEQPSLPPSRRAGSETSLRHSLRLTDAYAAYCHRYPTRVSGMHSSVNMEGRVVDHVLYENTHTICSHVLHLGEVAAIPNRNIPSDHYMVGAILVPRGVTGDGATFDT